MRSDRLARLAIVFASTVILLLALAACSGPEANDDTDPTPTSPPTFTPTPTSTPTLTPTATQTATPEPTVTPTPEVSPTVTPTPTATPQPTATSVPVALIDQVLAADQLPGDGFALANQGPRTALELANAYRDSTGHLDRLDSWGFKEHYFREFTRERSGPEDPLPDYVLLTINEYGSPDQADEAIDWLRQLYSGLGHDFAEPPDFGENGIASTVETAEGTPTAITFVRLDSRVYAAYAESGDPLPFVLEAVRSTIARVQGTEE